MTEAIKPLTTREPSDGYRVYLMPRNTPAMPARMPDRTKASWMMRVESMPISWAVSRSKETARRARPMRVFWMMYANTSRATALMMSIMASLVEITMPPALMVGFLKKAGKLKKLEPALMVTSPSYKVPSVMDETKK